MIDFWKRVHERMSEMHIRMADLSKLTDIPQSTLSNWVRRDTLPDSKRGAAIAMILGVTVEKLISGTDVLIDYREIPDPPEIQHVVALMRSLPPEELQAMETAIFYMAKGKEKQPTKKRR